MISPWWLGRQRLAQRGRDSCRRCRGPSATHPAGRCSAGCCRRRVHGEVDVHRSPALERVGIQPERILIEIAVDDVVGHGPPVIEPRGRAGEPASDLEALGRSSDPPQFAQVRSHGSAHSSACRRAGACSAPLLWRGRTARSPTKLAVQLLESEPCLVVRGAQLLLCDDLSLYARQHGAEDDQYDAHDPHAHDEFDEAHPASSEAGDGSRSELRRHQVTSPERRSRVAAGESERTEVERYDRVNERRTGHRDPVVDGDHRRDDLSRCLIACDAAARARIRRRASGCCRRVWLHRWPSSRSRSCPRYSRRGHGLAEPRDGRVELRGSDA